MNLFWNECITNQIYMANPFFVSEMIAYNSHIKSELLIASETLGGMLRGGYCDNDTIMDDIGFYAIPHCFFFSLVTKQICTDNGTIVSTQSL